MHAAAPGGKQADAMHNFPPFLLLAIYRFACPGFIEFFFFCLLLPAYLSPRRHLFSFACGLPSSVHKACGWLSANRKGHTRTRTLTEYPRDQNRQGGRAIRLLPRVRARGREMRIDVVCFSFPAVRLGHVGW